MISTNLSSLYAYQLGQEQLRLFLERGIEAHVPYGTFILDHAFEGMILLLTLFHISF